MLQVLSILRVCSVAWSSVDSIFLRPVSFFDHPLISICLGNRASLHCWPAEDGRAKVPDPPAHSCTCRAPPNFTERISSFSLVSFHFLRVGTQLHLRVQVFVHLLISLNSSLISVLTSVLNASPRVFLLGYPAIEVHRHPHEDLLQLLIGRHPHSRRLRSRRPCFGT